MNPDHVRFDLRRYDSALHRHAHQHHQLVIPLEGGLEISVAGRAELVTGNRLAAIPAGRPHTFSGAPHDRFLIVDVPRADDTGRGAIWEMAEARPFVPMAHELEGLVRFVAARTARGGLSAPRRDVMAGLIMESLLAGVHGQPTSHRALIRAMSYIDAHLPCPIGVSDIADAAAISVSRLHALFASELGITPMRHLARQRLHLASRLLRENLSIAEVVERCGYADQSTFTRAFSRATGETPGQYRRRSR